RPQCLQRQILGFGQCGVAQTQAPQTLRRRRAEQPLVIFERRGAPVVGLRFDRKKRGERVGEVDEAQRRQPPRLGQMMDEAVGAEVAAAAEVGQLGQVELEEFRFRRLRQHEVAQSRHQRQQGRQLAVFDRGLIVVARIGDRDLQIRQLAEARRGIDQRAEIPGLEAVGALVGAGDAQ
ncbi:hypothetical protein CATMIT_01930, partial [Catenibacterium mitsuokai DSM 15897]